MESAPRQWGVRVVEGAMRSPSPLMFGPIRCAVSIRQPAGKAGQGVGVNGRERVRIGPLGPCRQCADGGCWPGEGLPLGTFIR